MYINSTISAVMSVSVYFFTHNTCHDLKLDEGCQ